MMPRTLPRLLRLPPAWVTWNESRSCPFTKWESSSGRNSNSATHLITCCLQLSTRLKALAHIFMPVRLPLGPTPTASTLLSLAFSDGLRAVQAAEKLPPAVVLLDIGLPGP